MKGQQREELATGRCLFPQGGTWRLRGKAVERAPKGGKEDASCGRRGDTRCRNVSSAAVSQLFALDVLVLLQVEIAERIVVALRVVAVQRLENAARYRRDRPSQSRDRSARDAVAHEAAESEAEQSL
jgi:hypothetical protein